MRQFMKILLSLLFCSLLTCQYSSAGTKPSSTDGSHLYKTAINVAQRQLQGYNMRLWLSNSLVSGLQAWSGNPIPVEPHYGLEYPINSGIEHLYSGEVIIGASVNGVRRFERSDNGPFGISDFEPRFIHPSRVRFFVTSVESLSHPNRRGFDDDGDGMIDEDEMDGVDNDGDWNPLTDDVGADGLSDSLEISCDGTPYNPVTNPDPAQDNYDPTVQDHCHISPNNTYPLKNNKDVWTEKNGIPDHGEPHVDEDYAAISNNDLHTTASDEYSQPAGLGPAPLGVRVTQRSYAWRTSFFIDATLFLAHDFINGSTHEWNDVFIGYYADMDVGHVGDSAYWSQNVVAYDSLTRTAYVYNPLDAGSTPLGITILNGGMSFDSLKFIFRWSVPSDVRDSSSTDSSLYSWMSGEMYPNELIRPNQDVIHPEDVRFFFSMGPYQMHPGDTVKHVYAYVSGMSVDEMLQNARNAQTLYDNQCVLGIRGDNTSTPHTYFLSQSYPNPCNPATVIHYALPVSGHVVLKVYDMLGKEIATLVDETKYPGEYAVTWNADHFASGVYFYSLNTGNYVETKKLVLIK